MTPFSRVTEAELAEMEADARIYPYVSVLEHVQRLREAYAEIDRLIGVAEETGEPAV
jgi:hypothetical protein